MAEACLKGALFVAITCVATVLVAYDEVSVASRATANDVDGDPLPEGVVARLGTKRYRPTHSARAVAFLPGTHILSYLTNEGALERWNADTGRLERTVSLLPAERESFTCAVATSDGRFFAARGVTFREDAPRPLTWLALVEADTGRIRWRHEIEEFHGECIAVSQDGRTLAADTFADGERQVHVFDVATESQIAAGKFGKQTIRSMAFSPDGATLALGADGGIVRLWKWQTDQVPREVDICPKPRQSSLILSLAFSPNGASLAAGPYRSEETGVFLVPLEAPHKKLGLSVEGVTFWHPRSVVYSRDGRYIAAPIQGGNARGGVAVWNTATGEVVHRFVALQTHFTWLAFSRHNRRLAAASDWDTQLAVWDLETGKRLGDELPGHALPAQNLKFVSTDVLATAGDDASLRLWDIKKAQALHTIRIDNGNLDNCWIRAMDVSPDGTKLATSTLDDSVRLWDAGTGQELWRRPGHGKLGGHRALRFEPIGKSLVSWGDDLYVRRWNVTSGEKRTEARLMPAGVKLPKEPAAGADPFRAARLGTGLISADCSRLIMELGKTAYVFDIESGQELGKFPSEAHDAARVAITPDSELMLIQRWLGPQAKEHTASLIRTADGGIEREVSLPGRYGNAVAISKDGRLAAVGFGDVEPEVRVLSLPELKEIARLTGCASQAKALAFHPSGESLAISTADTSVLVWRFRRE